MCAAGVVFFLAVTAETSSRWSATRRSGYALAVAGEVVVAIALLAGAGILAESQATDHSRLHAAVALAVLAVAGVILGAVPRPSIASRAPVVGLALFAGAQLLESVGALGYGPDNDTRQNSIVVAHDIGVLATGITMLTLFVALAISAGAIVGGRSRLGIMAGVVLGIVAVGFFLVRLLVLGV